MSGRQTHLRHFRETSVSIREIGVSFRTRYTDSSEYRVQAATVPRNEDGRYYSLHPQPLRDRSRSATTRCHEPQCETQCPLPIAPLGAEGFLVTGAAQFPKNCCHESKPWCLDELRQRCPRLQT